jgi:tyrosine-protein kinase Etk/Wzc
MSRDPYTTRERPPGQHDPDALARLLSERGPGVSGYVASARPYLLPAALAVLIGTLLAAAVAFLWPPTYRGEVVLLPPTEEETGFSPSVVLRGIAVPGVRLPTRSGPEDVSIAILKSRRVGEALVRRFDLLRAYKVPREEPAIRMLQQRSSIKLGESGTVIIRVLDHVPKRAADLANAYAEELDRFNREIRMTKGRRTRVFVEQRILETRRDLAQAEEALRRYGERHRTVALSADQLSSAESAARLVASQASLEVQLGMARQYAAEGSEEVRRLRQQLDQINRLIGALPEQGLELARLVRDVKIHEQVYALLSAQFEEARINEARDVSTVEVLDPARTPDRRYWPRRGLLIGLGFLLSGFGALVWIAWNVRSRSV